MFYTPAALSMVEKGANVYNGASKRERSMGMAHEILSVKLYEMDKEFAKLHSRIELSDKANLTEIRDEIKSLEKECRERKVVLRKQLKYSRSPRVQQISAAYDEIEEIIRKTQDGIFETVSGQWTEEMTKEEMALLAEYSLDFAVQAANDALLVSMEAIQMQMEGEES